MMIRNVLRHFAVAAVALIGTAASAISIFAQSDSLVLQYPVGGEIYYTNRDTVVTIRWDGVSDTTRIRLEWSVDARRWNVIADSATSRRFDWNITGLPISTTYRVRARMVRAPYSSDNVRYEGHSGDVFDGAWDPAGERIVTVSREVHVWDAEIGGSIPLVALPAANENQLGADWSADSTMIAVGSSTATVLYDTRTDQVLQTYPEVAPAFKVAFNTASTRVVSANENITGYHDVPPGSATLSYNPVSNILDINLAHAGDRTLVCTEREATVWTHATGAWVQFRLHQAGVLSGSWSPTDSMICTIGGDRTIRAWNSTTSQELWNAIDDQEGVRCIAFAPDGTTIAVGMSDSTVTLWDAATGNQTASFSGHRNTITSVAWAPQGDLLASASDDNSIRVHNIVTGRLEGAFLHTNDVRSIAWSPDGSRILSTSSDGTAIVWRVREFTLQGDTSAAFSISDPPPAFARFTASGDTINIADETTITVRLRDSYNLDLADIDSVEFTLRYDGTMLDRLSATVPIVSEQDSVNHQILRFKPIALPTSDSDLLSVTFRGTLGADSVSSLHFSGIRQIGSGSPIPVDSRSDSILIRGICRSGGIARLYNPIGVPLQIRPTPSGGGVMVDLAEQGPTSVQVYDILGQLVWRDDVTEAELRDRFFVRDLPRSVASKTVLVVVTTPTQNTSILLSGGRQ